MTISQDDFVKLIDEYSAYLVHPRFRDCPLIVVSDGCEMLWGYSRDLIIGRDCRFVGLGCDIDDVTKEKWQSACSQGDAFSEVVQNQKKDGSYFSNLLSMRSLGVGNIVYRIALQTELSPVCDAESIQELKAQHAYTFLKIQGACLTNWMDVQLRRNSVIHDDMMFTILYQEFRENFKSEQSLYLFGPTEEVDCKVQYCNIDGMPVPDDFQEMVALQSIQQCSVSVSLANPRLPDCPLVGLSHGFEELTGYTRGEIIGKNCRFLQQGCRNPKEMMERLRYAVRTGEEFIGILSNRKKHGQFFDNLLHLRTIRIGSRAYIMGVQADVTGKLHNKWNHEDEMRAIVDNMMKSNVDRWVESQLTKFCINLPEPFRYQLGKVEEDGGAVEFASLETNLARITGANVFIKNTFIHFPPEDEETDSNKVYSNGRAGSCPPPLRSIMAPVKKDEVVEFEVLLSKSSIMDCPISLTVSNRKLPDYPLIAISEQFTKMTGYSRKQVLGHNCRFLNSGMQISPKIREKLQKAVNQGTSFTTVIPNSRKDATIFQNLVHLQSVKIGGRSDFLLGLQMDVSNVGKAMKQEALAKITKGLFHEVRRMMSIFMQSGLPAWIIRQEDLFYAKYASRVVPGISDYGAAWTKVNQTSLFESLHTRLSQAYGKPVHVKNTMVQLDVKPKPILRRTLSENNLPVLKENIIEEYGPSEKSLGNSKIKKVPSMKSGRSSR